MDALSATIIKSALDGLAMRQAYTAQNVANASSPDFAPYSVDFEGRLMAASKEGMAAIEAVNPEVSRGAVGALRLDLELATAAQTAMRFGALVDVMGRQMSLTMSVIREGR